MENKIEFDLNIMGSMDIAEINPALDTKNSTAKIAVDLTASLFGRQIFPTIAKS